MNGTAPKVFLARYSSALRGTGLAGILSILFALSAPMFAARAAGPPPEKAALILAAQATETRLASLRKDGFAAVALMLTDTNATREAAAARVVREAKLPLDYWIEVARNPAMADAHPEWMASIQTHEEWRRFFPEFPKPGSNDMVKVYPWVPMLYRETFDAHLQRLTVLLRNKPAPRRIFLNDLQGAPSACGCGHHLCRWTTDYGPLKSATRLPNDAAAKFVAAVKQLAPGAEVIPVWITECEAHDRDGLCAGVSCFSGTCWREWTAQLMPLAAEARTLAALVPYRAFRRDLPVYEQPAGWVSRSLAFFRDMPARYKTNGVPASRLIAVVQGWDVSQVQIEAQLTRAVEVGAAGIVVAYGEIEQAWEPHLFKRGKD